MFLFRDSREKKWTEKMNNPSPEVQSVMTPYEKVNMDIPNKK